MGTTLCVTRLAARTFGVLASVIALAGCDAPVFLPPGATKQSAIMHALWVEFFWLGLGVAVVVWGLIFWCVIRYRRRPGREAEQFRTNVGWTYVYVIAPFILAAVLFALTYPGERSIEALAPGETVHVEVTGFRWSWRFAYPGLGASVAGTPAHPPVFELPVDEISRMSVTSVDVDHSFWVPGFLFKRDAIPGITNVFDFTPTKVGTYRGECGEFCGLDHAVMFFAVRVVPRPEFDRWIRDHRTVAMLPKGALR